MSNSILQGTHVSGIGERKVGKVRDIYVQSDKIILVSTDRHSSFDRIIAHIPRKGEVLNRVSRFWFEKTAHIIQNHVLELPDPNVLVAKRCRPIGVESVMRGYITGVTGTSLWTHYSKGVRDFGNFTLPDGMKKNQKLDTPVFTPSTKEEAHDRTLSPDELVTEGIVSRELLDQVEEVSRALFTYGQDYARSRGLILVDTKYEFGLDEHDKLMLIDEIHTPDSSRYWRATSYEERFAGGQEPEYFDKEFLRLWFIDHCDPYNDATLPEAPEDMVMELSRRYQTIFTELTGERVSDLSDEPIGERIERALQPYVLV